MKTRLEVFAALDAIGREKNTAEYNMVLAFQGNWLRDNGWRYVSRGMYKEVFKHPDHDFVVKLHGSGANELENSMDAPIHIAPFLVPIWQGIGFQLQDTVEMRQCPDPRACDEHLACVCDSAASSYEKYPESLPHNHTHDEAGFAMIYDYGQEPEYQWKGCP